MFLFFSHIVASEYSGFLPGNRFPEEFPLSGQALLKVPCRRGTRRWLPQILDQTDTSTGAVPGSGRRIFFGERRFVSSGMSYSCGMHAWHMVYIGSGWSAAIGWNVAVLFQIASVEQPRFGCWLIWFGDPENLLFPLMFQYFAHNRCARPVWQDITTFTQ